MGLYDRGSLTPLQQLSLNHVSILANTWQSPWRHAAVLCLGRQHSAEIERIVRSLSAARLESAKVELVKSLWEHMRLMGRVLVLEKITQ